MPLPGVVTVQDPFEAGLAAWYIARALGAPLHVQVHTDFLSPGYARHSLINRVRVSLARFVLSRAARVRVVSERIKKALEESGMQVPIAVLPIYVDVERLQKAGHPALTARFAAFDKCILIVSRLEPEKNLALGISAFALSAPKDACLIIVGGGSERSRLEAEAREWNIADRVFFEGEQPAASYYALADLLLVTSFYEGYGLVIIEALAAGKPVLSTDVGVAREAGAIVVSPKEFTAALKSWFDIGSRVGRLNAYPYKNFDEYVRSYCADIAASTQTLDSR
jgi:glycosyltransferase involved in cell wall biosynthesis